MLAEDLAVIEADSPLWRAVRPLVDVALRLEQNDNTYEWYGWKKQPLDVFLSQLPEHCALLVGVWETLADEPVRQEREVLALGCVCEVMKGEIHSIRTFEAITDADLPDIEDLEPGIEHALELMRAARLHVAPVAWALFTDKVTWNEWLLTCGNDGSGIDKGELLASLTSQGRCVLMGSQTRHHHP